MDIKNTVIEIMSSPLFLPPCPKKRSRSGNSWTILSYIGTLGLALFLRYTRCDAFAPISNRIINPPASPLISDQHQNQYLPRQDSSYQRQTLCRSSLSEHPTISSILTVSNCTGGVSVSTNSTSHSLAFPLGAATSRLKKLFFLRKNRFLNDIKRKIDFNYDYDVVKLPCEPFTDCATTGVILIHPIGVGIARWYYQRLVSTLIEKHGEHQLNKNLVIVVPDLLGSGSACNATIGTTFVNGGVKFEVAKRFPLFNISDWAEQVESLMSKLENPLGIDQWCVVANGGCSPIALQVAERRATIEENRRPVSNLVLSSVPRLPFFLKNSTTSENGNDPKKIARSYRTLSGVVGDLFYWYACRNEGAFLQSFSEKNLIADPSNLGPTWRPNCYQTAISCGGKGKYSTFSFLSGTLQDGCVPSLNSLQETPVKIDIIKGADVRRNRARSWFWKKSKTKQAAIAGKADAVNETENVGKTTTEQDDGSRTTYNRTCETFRDYVRMNGNGGREVVIGGRISLAHEDPHGYADALLNFLG